MSRIAGTAEFYRLIYLDSGRLTSLNDDFGIINEFIDSVSTLSFSSSFSILFDKRKKCELREKVTNPVHFQGRHLHGRRRFDRRKNLF